MIDGVGCGYKEYYRSSVRFCIRSVILEWRGIDIRVFYLCKYALLYLFATACFTFLSDVVADQSATTSSA